jgi:hypothetical protein
LPWVGFCRTMEPVSSTDFRLEISIGQAPDTTAMKFEGLRSMVWVMKSSTAGHRIPAPSCSTTRFGPFARACSDAASRSLTAGGSASTISPASVLRPSRYTNSHEGHAVHWLSRRTPNQYCFMNSTSVSVDHSISGVVRIGHVDEGRFRHWFSPAFVFRSPSAFRRGFSNIISSTGRIRPGGPISLNRP